MKPLPILSLSLSLLFISCNDNSQSQKNGTKLLDYKSFTIRVPENWKRVDVRGIDSFVGRIDIDSVTSIGFDMGWYCDPLVEGRSTSYYIVDFGNVFLPDSSKKQNLNEPTFWKYYGKADSSTIEKVKRNVVTMATIDGYKAKIVTPKKPGLGTTGVYIDSLWKSGDKVDGFVLTGENLTSKQQQQLQAAIKSLKFNRKVFNKSN